MNLRQLIMLASIVARLERQLDAKRRFARVKSGEIVGPKSNRYGVTNKSGVLVKVPEEQAVITLIRERHAAGASMRCIARELNALGIKPRRGKEWTVVTVTRQIRYLDDPGIDDEA
jgi:DNA invertase Pin-like site-specific DNA recombinase